MACGWRVDGVQGQACVAGVCCFLSSTCWRPGPLWPRTGEEGGQGLYLGRWWRLWPQCPLHLPGQTLLRNVPPRGLPIPCCTPRAVGSWSRSHGACAGSGSGTAGAGQPVVLGFPAASAPRATSSGGRGALSLNLTVTEGSSGTPVGQQEQGLCTDVDVLGTPVSCSRSPYLGF